MDPMCAPALQPVHVLTCTLSQTALLECWLELLVASMRSLICSGSPAHFTLPTPHIKACLARTCTHAQAGHTLMPAVLARQNALASHWRARANKSARASYVHVRRARQSRVVSLCVQETTWTGLRTGAYLGSLCM